MKKLILVLFFNALILGCASHSQYSDLEKVFKKMSDGEYNDLIESFSQKDSKYNGFYNTYQVTATIINSRVQEALLQREGYFMQWEPAKAQTEREKSFQEMSSSSKVFISLFTPENGHNDLHKEASMWKVFLESNGLRYKGRVQKFNKNLVQTQNLYPYHTRFNKGYIATFDIPMSAIEKQDNVLILTSSLGTTTFKFSGL